MVFKTICVGSIPAIFDLILKARVKLTRKKHRNQIKTTFYRKTTPSKSLRPQLTSKSTPNKFSSATQSNKPSVNARSKNHYKKLKSMPNSLIKFKIYKDAKLRNVLTHPNISRNLIFKMNKNVPSVKNHNLFTRFQNLNMDINLIKSGKIPKKPHILAVFWKNISKKKHKLLSHRLQVSKSH